MNLSALYYNTIIKIKELILQGQVRLHIRKSVSESDPKSHGIEVWWKSRCGGDRGLVEIDVRWKSRCGGNRGLVEIEVRCKAISYKEYYKRLVKSLYEIALNSRRGF